MSHFTVMVIGEDVEEQLWPYHEFECTGMDNEYVQDIDITKETMECIKDNANALGEIQDYCGYEVVHGSIDKEDKHKYGYILVEGDKKTIKKIINRTNPNAKWDWWVIGGRWSGFLLLKDGNRSNQAKLKDIDIEKMKEESKKEAIEFYDKRYKLVNHHLNKFKTWEQVLEIYKDSIDEARQFYHNQGACVVFRENKLWDNPDFLVDKSREEYIDSQVKSTLATFAVIKDKKWYERGKMGWWACVSNKKDEDKWLEEFNNLLDGLDGETLITIVDCHI